MTGRTTTAIIIFALLILLPLGFLLTSNPECMPTNFVGGINSNARLDRTPEEIVGGLIERYNGLPKTNGDLSILDQDQIHPVEEWRIIESRMARVHSLLHSIFDDDPTYAISAELEVSYSDGTSQTLHWRSWRYGIVVCPFVFVRGDGPPGTIEVVSE